MSKLMILEIIAYQLILFTSALIVIIGIITFIAWLARLLNKESDKASDIKAARILIYSVILVAFGSIWLYFCWEGKIPTVVPF